MNTMLLLIICIGLGLVVLLLYSMKNKKNKISVISMSSPEQKALLQLRVLRKQLRDITLSDYNKSFGAKFYRRIRIIMTVYMKGKYDVTISDTIDKNMMEYLLSKHSEQEKNIKQLQIFFNAINRIKHEGNTHSDMYEIYDSIILFLDGNVEKRNTIERKKSRTFFC